VEQSRVGATIPGAGPAPAPHAIFNSVAALKLKEMWRFCAASFVNLGASRSAGAR
jgi:hypothetical protein